MINTHDKLRHEKPGYEKEGVIKYQLQFHEQALSEDEYLDELNTSRRLLKERGLIGQDPYRYGGDGFGNISVRIKGLVFLISGSQTGHLDVLTNRDVALVDHFTVDLNQLTAHGLTRPSSESMTHGVCFQTYADITAVVHVHSPDIWNAMEALELPFTDQSIPYGTPQMAEAVAKVLKKNHQACQPTIFAMKGHEDGIVAVGDSLASCTSSLLACLNQSILMKRHLDE
tara:strand:+ start:2449 stop:3132 length:684 start_codon:yes stop_codon:yes gene_type:complete